ncbi:hypothetical protein CGLO_17408 [Colletotrichum gloeosporioides Cg-14]|uniref:Alpha and gamma adaptin binding protein p34 n=1 Tax=Colletotrichum gloeosporioides (strain Cg-14) TaxID=1237896 RepID=T0KWX0_COLGC|nr:hypothetical protein CGLO_17408 [Colletotrichum gloeosporioides Cg-14]
MAEVSNPRRVLAVSLAESTQHLSRVIKDLTGVVPEPASTSLAGTTHLLDIKTSYYTAQVPIWLDLITSPAEWSASFLSPEAKEVLSVLGGLAVVFALPPPPSSTTTAAPPSSSSPPPAAAAAAPPAPPPTADETRALISEVGKVVREGLGGWAWDGVGLGIGVGEGDAEEWEELCAEWGLEFVQVRGGKKDDGRNEFGEKMGIPRVLEALESNDWAADAGPDVDSDLEEVEAEMAGLPRKPRPLADGDDGDEFDFDPESLDFGFDRADFEGLKKAIWNLEQEQQQVDDEDEGKDGDKKKDGEGSKDATKREAAKAAADEEEERLDAEEIEKLEGMMRKLQAVRDMSAGMPVEQARKMAKKAVSEVMKEL